MTGMAHTPLDEIITPDRDRSDVIAILREAQDLHGCLLPPLMDEIAQRLGMKYAEVYGIVSFYEHFHCEPRGQHLIRVCRGTACHVRGANEILHAVTRALGVEDGGTTEDGLFTLSTVACLGTCSLAPVMMVDDDYFGKMTPDGVAKVLDSYRETAKARAEGSGQ